MAEEYARMVARAVVVQLCDSFGFASLQRSALDALTDILCRYIESVGRSSHEFAEACGRTEGNLQDVLLSLEEMGTTLQDLVKFVDYAEESGPGQPVPAFPVQGRTRATTPSFLQRGEHPTRPEIPEWLPSFPDPHTYAATPVWEEKGRSELEGMEEEGRQRRKAEQSLVRLHNRMEALTAGGYQGASAVGCRLWGEDTARAGPAAAAAAAVALAQAAGDEIGGMPVAPPSLADAFAPALRDHDKHASHVAAEVGTGSQPNFEVAESTWTGWSVPVKPAAAAMPAKPDGPSFGVAFGLASPFKKRALAVRCRVAVKPKDVLDPGARTGERRERGAREDEQEEKRRKVDQMLREAENTHGV